MKDECRFPFWIFYTLGGYAMAIAIFFYGCYAFHPEYFTNPNDLSTQYMSSENAGEYINITGLLSNNSQVVFEDVSITADGYDSEDHLIASVKMPAYPALKNNGKLEYKFSIIATGLVKIILIPESRIGTGRWQTVLLGE